MLQCKRRISLFERGKNGSRVPQKQRRATRDERPAAFARPDAWAVFAGVPRAALAALQE